MQHFTETDLLTLRFVRTNLRNFNCGDLIVTGILRAIDGKRTADGKRAEIGRAEMLLSDLCVLRFKGLAKQLGIESQVGFYIDIEQDGQPIGYVDDDGNFNYWSAPDLRTALVWSIATASGRRRVVKHFDIDQAAASLLGVIQDAGLEQAAFRGPYFDALRAFFVDDRRNGSDSYLQVASTLWRVATREIGVEHPGYMIMC